MAQLFNNNALFLNCSINSRKFEYIFSDQNKSKLTYNGQCVFAESSALLTRLIAVYVFQSEGGHFHVGSIAY